MPHALYASKIQNMGVSKNNCTSLIGFSIINHPFWGTPIFGNTHMLSRTSAKCAINIGKGPLICIKNDTRRSSDPETLWPRWGPWSFSRFNGTWKSAPENQPSFSRFHSLNVGGVFSVQYHSSKMAGQKFHQYQLQFFSGKKEKSSHLASPLGN